MFISRGITVRDWGAKPYWIVGSYDPSGTWIPAPEYGFVFVRKKDHSSSEYVRVLRSEEQAARYVHWLNGGADSELDA